MKTCWWRGKGKRRKRENKKKKKKKKEQRKWRSAMPWTAAFVGC